MSAQVIWNFCKSNGMTDAGAAGLMGNLYAESALSPTNLQNSYETKLGMTDEEYTSAVDNGSYTNFVKDSAGYGLCQWTYWTRKQGLLTYCQSRGVSIGDLEAQLGYLMQELTQSYPAVLSVLRSAATVLGASNAVLLQFEKPADQSVPVQTKRAAYGQTYYDQFAGGECDLDIVSKTSTHNTSKKTGRSVQYIVIHYTAGTSSKSGSAANVASYFSTTTTQASADFIVDDANIVQYNPDIANRYTWHCGGSKSGNQGGSYYGICSNSNSIGIEMCSTNSTGKVTNANDKYWSISSATVSNTVELVKYLMAAYGIPAENVIRHYDVTGKLCPGVVGWNEDSGSVAKWAAFKAQLVSTITEEDDDMDVTRFEELMNEYRETLQDNDASSWSQEARDWATSTGLIQGNGTTIDGEPNYMWNDILSRQQFVTVLYRFSKAYGLV